MLIMMMILVIVSSKGGRNKHCVFGLNLVHRIGQMLHRAFIGGVMNNKLGK